MKFNEKEGTFDIDWRQAIIYVCGQVAGRVDDIVRVIDESEFDKPVVTIKIFSDQTLNVNVSDESMKEGWL